MSEKKFFPANFKWGTATAAFQIEGATNEGGRGESIWDTFAHTPGKVKNGDTGDIACDHYHHWKEDIRIMKDLGYKAYRFSIAWPRILPEGKGKVNQTGLDFYDQLINELLRADILPLITLYHWDLPTSLAGGWLDRSVVDAFAEYTGIVVRAFGDRVKDWITINEPFCASILGYKLGIHAPGVQDPYQALIAAHYLLLAHGRSVSLIRSACTGARVGIALNMGPYYTPTRSQPDLEAARHADGEVIRWFLDPLYGRLYPADMVRDFRKMGVLKSEEPLFIKENDMAEIATPTDFLGVNYYTRNTIKAGRRSKVDPSSIRYIPAPKQKQTEMGWEVFPFGLYETLCRIHWEYKPGEIIVTENGASYSEEPDDDGKLHDERRIGYLRKHLLAVGKSIDAGVPVTGYYVWSLLDNFEWSMGYSQRFGIVHVDYNTQDRTPKDSAYWYSQVIKNNGISA